MKKVTKAVIPVAGLGTRFLPATKATPKEMLTIVDIPAIEYIVREAVESGITDILFITSRSKNIIGNHFDINPELENILLSKGKTEEIEKLREISSLCNFHYVRQQEPKGLGHAINHARVFAGNDPFAVLLGDDVVYNKDKPCIGQLIDVYNEFGGIVLGSQTVSHDDISKYGAIKCEKIKDRIYSVSDMIEKPKKEEAPSDIAVLGRYILTPEIFDALDNTKPGAGGEIQLTDAIKALIGKIPVYGYDFEGRRYDTGNKQGYLQAVVEYALRRDDLKDEFKEFLKETVKNM